MKQTIIRIIEAAIILAAIVAVVRPYYLGKISANTKCYANSGELCPDGAFLGDYDAMIQLQHDLDDGKQSSAVKRLITMSDQLAGLTYRLEIQKPKGYKFNSEKRKFIAEPVPAAAAPAPMPPPPTPQAVAAPPVAPSDAKPEVKKK